MQKYPYYTVASIESGQMQKLFRDKKYPTNSEATAALGRWANKHKKSFETMQFVTIEYSSQFQSKILGIYTNGAYLYVCSACDQEHF